MLNLIHKFVVDCYFTDQPIDKAPVEQTHGDQVLLQHSKTAKTLLGDFNLNEAGKMVQKRRPASSILDEELLLSEDESDNPPAAKKAVTETENKETKPSAAEKPQQADKPIANKSAKTQQQGGNNLKRKKVMNRSPSNSRPGNNGPMNLNANQPDGGDLFMRKRNFMGDSDMGGGFDRQQSDNRGFNMGSNFMNDRNMNNSNNFANNRDFGDDFSRRPAKNDGFNNFGNRGANGGGGGSGGGGRMFNRY